MPEFNYHPLRCFRAVAHGGNLTRTSVGLAVLPPIEVQDELNSGRLIEADRLPGIGETFFTVTTTRRLPNPSLQNCSNDPQFRQSVGHNRMIVVTTGCKCRVKRPTAHCHADHV